MVMKVEYFSADLTDRLEATDIYLPLSPPATADLLSILSEPTDYMYLTLKGEVYLETVRVRNEGGTLLLDRGIEGTDAVLHHYGTCVTSVSPTIIAVIKDIHCNYSCCEPDDCPCNPVVYSGAVLPSALVGVAWEGSVVFAGDLPIKMGISDDIPSWVTVITQGNLMTLTGTPDEASAVTFSVTATNCNGTQLAVKTLSFDVTN